MNQLERNDVTREQLSVMIGLLKIAIEGIEEADKKLDGTGKKHSPTTNWHSSGLRGVELITRFVAGLLGSVDAQKIEAIYLKLVLTQEGRRDDSYATPPKTKDKVAEQIKTNEAKIRKARAKRPKPKG